MIVQLGPDAPAVVRAAAAAVLVAHIGGASLGLLSGTVSILARKGGRLHRFAGDVFFAAMLSMSAAAAISAPWLPDRFSTLMGVFVFYLTLTGWLAARPPSAATRRLLFAGLAVALGAAAAYLVLARIGAHLPNGELDGEPSMLGYPAALIALLAAGGDVKVLRRSGLAGAQRLRRHLWRMTTALAIAWGSFAGQPKAQPEMLRGSPLIAVPALVTLALLVFWLIRTRSRRPVRPAPALAPAQEALT